MNERRGWKRNTIGGLGAAALACGCSVLYDFNTSQCNETQDCKNQGPQFNYSVCVNHVCVQTSGEITGGAPATGGGGNGGAGGGVGGVSNLGGTQSTGGGVSSAGGSEYVGGTNSLGGAANGGNSTSLGGTAAGGVGSGVGGTIATGGISAAGGVQPSGGAGTGGASSGPECTTNAFCISKYLDVPYICRSGSCVALKSENCPVVFPTQSSKYQILDLLKQGSPILVGAFANMGDPADPHNTQAILNWDLAFDEFNTRTLGGLPGFQGGLRRPLIGVACQGRTDVKDYPKDITNSMKHLTEDVGISSVLSTLAPDDLLAAWNTRGGNGDVIFMNTGSANNTLVNTPNGNLLWHILGDANMLAETAVALLHQMEPYIYKQRKTNFASTGKDDPDAEPLRVTMVYSSHPTMLDMHDVMKALDSKHPAAHLTFNGKPWYENGADYREVPIDSIEVVSPPDVTPAVNDIKAHPPHVILAMATSEFPASAITPIEEYWSAGNNNATGMIRPYYIMSHLIYNTGNLPNLAGSYSSKKFSSRVAGINYAEAQDAQSKALYDSYLTQLLNNNPNPKVSLGGTENYYDGAYYLLYALVSASRQYASPPAAAVSSNFMQHVIADTGATVYIGPSAIADTVISLTSGTPYYMRLWGTMGPPNFDKAYGTRTSQTSAWCLQNTGSGWAYQADGLIYDAASKTYAAPLSGNIPTALQNYCPPDPDAGVGTCPENY